MTKVQCIKQIRLETVTDNEVQLTKQAQNGLKYAFLGVK